MYSCSNMDYTSLLLLLYLSRKGFPFLRTQWIRMEATQAQHKSLLSHLQSLGSFKHKEHIIAPSDARIVEYITAQCLHSSTVHILIRALL